MSGDDIVDPACVPDIFTTELAAVETLGNSLRLVFVVPRSVSPGVPWERIVVARIIIAKEDRQRIARMIGDPKAAELEMAVQALPVEGAVAH